MILAHGIGGRSDLPVPLTVLIGGATAVLVISFLALGLLWPTPRLQDGPRETGRAVVAPVRGLLATLGLLGLFLVIGQIVPPLLGLEREIVRPTIAPVMVWVVFWLIVPFLGALIGNWYTDLNPWRTLAGAFGIGKGERVGILDRVGVWPAAVVLTAFVWLELIWPRSGDPTTLGIAALSYSIVLLIVMATVGRETGLASVDAFTPYNRLISAIAPLGRRSDGRLVWRGWLRALPVIPEWAGLWMFVVVMIATVSYDGAAGADWFRTITGNLGDTMLGQTVLLLASIWLVAMAYYLACTAAAALSKNDWRASQVAQRFAHTLVPIALAYAVSHYFTLIIFEGQQVIAALSDPFGLGWDLFGTADYRVKYFLTSSGPTWLIQVGFIVLGHIVGVVLAHDRALQDFGRDAMRSQYAMLALMIALTSLGLLILSG